MKSTQQYKENNPRDIIDILNRNYFDATESEIIPFTYATDGYVELIYFMEWPLWSSEANGYDWEEDGDTQIPLIVTIQDLYTNHLALLKTITLDVLFPE